LFKSTTVLVLISAALLAGPRPAAAQAQAASDAVMFLNLNAGIQPQQRNVTTTHSFTVYDEAATVTSSQPIEGGPMFDVTAGYRVKPNFALAVGVSLFSTTGTSSLQAAIPDPIFTDRPRITGATTTGLHHIEVGVHLQAVWFFPVTERIDVALSAGPSLFRLSQELTPTVTVPAGTQNIVVVTDTQTGTALGFNAGFDGSYMFKPELGLGVFARYAGASAELESADKHLTVGGFQTGLGLRVRF
jgi:hypothetical protein